MAVTTNTQTLKIIEDIRTQISKLDQQLIGFESIRKEQNRLKKILKLMMKDDCQEGLNQRAPAGLTQMVFESLQEIGESNNQQILHYLTGKRDVPVTINLADSIRSCFHRLKLAGKIVSPSHGVWRVISEKSTEKQNDGPPSINDILNPPPLMAGRR